MNPFNKQLFALSLAAVCACGQQLVEFPAAPAPTVVSTDPSNASAGVAVTSTVSVTFSRAMDPLTINTATFTLAQGAMAVPGTIAYAGSTATFTPAAPLTIDRLYTATITAGAKDPATIALAADHVWTFYTGLAPALTSTSPADGATLVALNVAARATFSQPMDPATFTPASTFTVKEFASGNPVAGTSTCSGNTVTFEPAVNLLPNTKYQATITAAAKDLAGDALVSGAVPNPWTWTTGAAPDVLVPAITLTSPQDGATLVPVNAEISATFSEAMDESTLTTDTFTVKDPLNAAVAGVLKYDSQHRLATFTPTSPLPLDTLFTATVTSGARDLAGTVPR